MISTPIGGGSAVGLEISFYISAWVGRWGATLWAPIVLGAWLGGCEPSAELRLEAQAAIPVGQHPVAQVARDLDGDGDVDLAVAAYFGEEITILTNDGTGHLAPRHLPVPGNPVAIAAGDLDEDGEIDLAVALTSSGIVQPLFGPDFHPGPALGLDNAGALAIADLDRDGHLDLIGGRYTPGAIRILAGDGRGGFTLRASFEAPAGVSCIRAADLDGDGTVDLAVTASEDDVLTIYPGAAPDGRLVPTGSWPTAVAVAERDAAPPLLLVAANLGDRLDILDTADFSVRTLSTGRGPFAAAAGDLDGDGRPELAVTNKFEDTVTLFGPDLAPRSTLETGAGPTPIDLVDLDGDARLDVAVADGASNDVVLYLSR